MLKAAWVAALPAPAYLSFAWQRGHNRGEALEQGERDHPGLLRRQHRGLFPVRLSSIATGAVAALALSRAAMEALAVAPVSPQAVLLASPSSCVPRWIKGVRSYPPSLLCLPDP